MLFLKNVGDYTIRNEFFGCLVVELAHGMHFLFVAAKSAIVSKNFFLKVGYTCFIKIMKGLL